MNLGLLIFLMYIKTVSATNVEKKQEPVAFSNVIGACYLATFHALRLLIHPFQLEGGIVKTAALALRNQLKETWS